VEDLEFGFHVVRGWHRIGLEIKKHVVFELKVGKVKKVKVTIIYIAVSS